MSRKPFITTALAPWIRWSTIFLFFLAPACSGQPLPSRLGVGAWAGNQSSLTIKYYIRPTTSYELLLARDNHKDIALNTHLLHERSLPHSPLTLFIGLGGYAGLLHDDETHLGFGPSGSIGLNFFSKHFEVFLQGIPYVRIYPNVDNYLALGVGLRYYF